MPGGWFAGRGICCLGNGAQTYPGAEHRRARPSHGEVHCVRPLSLGWQRQRAPARSGRSPWAWPVEQDLCGEPRQSGGGARVNLSPTFLSRHVTPARRGGRGGARKPQLRAVPFRGRAPGALVNVLQESRGGGKVAPVGVRNRTAGARGASALGSFAFFAFVGKMFSHSLCMVIIGRPEFCGWWKPQLRGRIGGLRIKWWLPGEMF